MVRDLGELGINLQKIVTRLLSDQTLLKLLYYTDKDPLSKANLTSTQIQNEIYNKLIKVVPRIGSKDTAQSILSMRVLRGIVNDENMEIRNFTIAFDLIVPLTQWFIKDENMRPFAIMGRVQNDLLGKKINGFGQITGGDFTLTLITDEVAVYEMTLDIQAYD